MERQEVLPRNRLALTARAYHFTAMFAAFDQGLISGNSWLWLAPAACFLIGSVPFGFIIGRTQGSDLRKEGSGNIGATNAFRVLGPRWGMLVFTLDFLKGWLPIWWLGRTAPFHLTWTDVGSADAGLLVCALFIVLGHNYTPFLGFKGGKGIASSAGLLLALMPAAFLITAVVWGLTFLAGRIVSVASLAASLALPFAAWATLPDRPLLIGLCILLTVISIWRHRSNIARLMAGTEPAFRQSRGAPGDGRTT